VEWLLGFWLVCLGGVVGSFLNVVVYRLPAGMSIVAPASHCPRCKHPIRWRDNLPVFGWLLLGGRCRDCGAPIALRYMLVEALAAAMFLAVGLAHCPWPGSAWWPLGDEQVAARPLAESLVVCGHRLVLLCTLLPAWLIAWDGHRSPWRLYLPALVVGAAAWAAGDWVAPWPWSAAWGGHGWDDALAGFAVGGLVGGPATWLAARSGGQGTWFAPALVGLCLGWQPAGMIAAAAFGVALALQAVFRRRPRLRSAAFPLTLFLLTLGWVLWG
jgi:leader peptidase (prepilin peptidase)/N-methyltransferase